MTCIIYFFTIQIYSFCLTSRCIPSRLAVPPLAHNTGSPIDVPAIASALAECPSPITIIPDKGCDSLFWHNAVSTFTENLNAGDKYYIYFILDYIYTCVCSHVEMIYVYSIFIMYKIDKLWTDNELSMRVASSLTFRLAEYRYKLVAAEDLEDCRTVHPCRSAFVPKSDPILWPHLPLLRWNKLRPVFEETPEVYFPLDQGVEEDWRVSRAVEGLRQVGVVLLVIGGEFLRYYYYPDVVHGVHYWTVLSLRLSLNQKLVEE